MNKYVFFITFIVYYLIATFIFSNILFNSRINLTLVNKKTKEKKEPSLIFLIFYSLLWIIYIPISINKGEE